MIKIIDKEVEDYVKVIKFEVKDGDKKAGYGLLYIIRDDTHDHPWGHFDLHVDKDFRGQGIANEIMNKIIERAKKEGCYKLACTSRESRGLGDWYIKLGFKKHSIQYRMDFFDGKGRNW